MKNKKSKKEEKNEHAIPFHPRSPQLALPYLASVFVIIRQKSSPVLSW